MKEQLTQAIQTLVEELRKNGKQKTADFFLKAKSSIESECDGNREELIDTLTQLQRSGSLIQYANFNAKEENLWNAIHGLATEWRTIEVGR